MVIVKANAYGHGALQIAQLAQDNPHIDWLATAGLDEALTLRHNGITKNILVLSYAQEELLSEGIINNIDLVVYDISRLETLNRLAQQYNTRARIHIKVDTGLSRMGALPAAAEKIARYAQSLPHIDLKGIFTHCANSEENSPFSAQQIKIFSELLRTLKESSINIPYQHWSCSAAISTTDTRTCTLARAGLSTYGLWPSAYTHACAQKINPAIQLIPVLSWYTHPVQIKHIPPNSVVGYGCTYTVTRPTTIALLPVGYWEGYHRIFAHKAQVKIMSHYAPVIGRISMNITIIDITDIPGVTLDTPVLLLGETGECSAEKLAHHAGTISWEILTNINPMIPRIVSP